MIPGEKSYSAQKVQKYNNNSLPPLCILEYYIKIFKIQITIPFGNNSVNLFSLLRMNKCTTPGWRRRTNCCCPKQHQKLHIKTYFVTNLTLLRRTTRRNSIFWVGFLSVFIQLLMCSQIILCTVRHDISIHRTHTQNPYIEPLHRTHAQNPYIEPIHRTHTQNPYIEPIHKNWLY